MKGNMPKTQELYNDDIKQLVIERIKTIPPDKKISIGGEGDFTVSELIDSVEKKNKVGQKITAVQMKFLQSLKTGDFLDE